VRYFSVYGPRERPDKLFPRLFSALKHQTPLPVFEGSESHLRSFSFVGDIVSGTLCAMKNIEKASGEIFNIGTDQTSTTGQALELAQQISGKKLIIQKMPPRPGDQLSTKANLEKARRVLGFSPKVSLKDGLTQVWAWAQKEL
jgi:nucleoside-diphosphate-sugar epimerase